MVYLYNVIPLCVDSVATLPMNLKVREGKSYISQLEVVLVKKRTVHWQASETCYMPAVHTQHQNSAWKPVIIKELGNIEAVNKALLLLSNMHFAKFLVCYFWLMDLCQLFISYIKPVNIGRKRVGRRKSHMLAWNTAVWLDWCRTTTVYIPYLPRPFSQLIFFRRQSVPVLWHDLYRFPLPVHWWQFCKKMFTKGLGLVSIV